MQAYRAVATAHSSGAKDEAAVAATRSAEARRKAREALGAPSPGAASPAVRGPRGAAGIWAPSAAPPAVRGPRGAAGIWATSAAPTAIKRPGTVRGKKPQP